MGVTPSNTTKAPTRAQRFFRIRDAVFAQRRRLRAGNYSSRELICGPFRITFAPPGAYGPRRGYHMDIWPGRKLVAGTNFFMHQNKVCSVDWWPGDEIDIQTFRSGPWEEELLALLEAGNNLTYFSGPG